MRFTIRRPYLNIVGHRRIWYAISALIFVIALVAIFTRGLNFGIDFTGGTELTLKTRPGVTISTIRDVTGRFGYSDAQIQSAGGNTYIVRVPELTDRKKAELINGLGSQAGVEKDARGQYVIDVKDVGPGWGAQVSKQAVIALAVFIAAIMVYISFRFEFKMAVTAIIEILHDFVITTGIYALFGLEITPATVIAVLTILGYSLYDAIVIFDRVKENADQLTRQSKKTYSQTVNDSVNQVLVRSLNTSLTTLIPIVAILLFGGATLKAFALPLFIGVLSGTYSSIILAPPILSQWKETEPKYKAYRERVERGRVKGAVPVQAVKKTQQAARAPGGKAPAKAAAAVKAQPKAGAQPKAKAKTQPQPKAKTQPQPKAAQQPKAKAATAQRPGEAEPDGAPRPKPKPKQAVGRPAQPTSKSQAKSRTKGPGSGKKKKKKR